MPELLYPTIFGVIIKDTVSCFLTHSVV